jgi:hypothetical protein
MEKTSKNLGMLLLAIWLIAWGMVTLIPGLNSLELILAVFAIAAGILIFMDR